MGPDSLDGILDAIADRLAVRLAAHSQDLISQRDRRGLGPRRHREAVKRRRENGEGGAYINGRDYLLTPAALLEELERCAPQVPPDNDNQPSPGGGPRVKKARSAELEALKRETVAELRTLRQEK
jgi:hypothetical protein